MQGDSFSDFIGQGPILRLFLTTVFFGIVWLGLIAWIGYRANERRRREREGLPPLPSFISQLWTAMQNWSSSQRGAAATAVGRQLVNGTRQPAYGYGEDADMPFPDVDSLTAGLPEPDLASILIPPPPATPIKKESVVVAASRAEAAASLVVEEALGTPNGAEAENIGPEPRRSESTTYVPDSGEIPADAVEVLRVWRDVSDGSLIVQMGDKLFQTVPEMKDRGMAKRFMNLVKDLARLAQAGAQAAGLPPLNFEAAAAVISEQGAWATRRVEPVSMPVMKEVVATLEPRGSGDGGSSGSGIAEQIEELLQFRLSQTPIFQRRSIHVRPNYDGSLRIHVDGRSYEHVDDVVDVDVREFLQGVIREWEARQ